jgi:hypothetical protein
MNFPKLASYSNDSAVFVIRGTFIYWKIYVSVSICNFLYTFLYIMHGLKLDLLISLRNIAEIKNICMYFLLIWKIAVYGSKTDGFNVFLAPQ